MGIGDNVIATGLARGARDRGQLVAFGDGHRLIWDGNSEIVFRNNPNIARPGQERGANVVWVRYYKGHRVYNKDGGGRWLWNYKFKATPGEFWFGESEEVVNNDPELVIVEPNVPNKPCAPNKQWSLDRWKRVVEQLRGQEFKVRQFDYGGPNRVAPGIPTPTFRHAAAWLKRARLAILPEGGLHHAAAAVGTPAVVLFGGYTPPEVLGYDAHVNLTGGTAACGRYTACTHCAEAMRRITVDEVMDATEKILDATTAQAEV